MDPDASLPGFGVSGSLGSYLGVPGSTSSSRLATAQSCPIASSAVPTIWGGAGFPAANSVGFWEESEDLIRGWNQLLST